MKYKEGAWVTARKGLMSFESLLTSDFVQKILQQGKYFPITAGWHNSITGKDEYYLGASKLAWSESMLELGVLPEEYIVECSNVDQCNKVRDYYYNDKSCLSSDWDYVICKKDIKNDLTRSIERYIRDEYKHLPIFAFKQWKQIKQQTENLNKMETNQEINGIKIPKGYEFDQVENGIIKLKKCAVRMLTHKKIINAEAGKEGFCLGCTSGIVRYKLSEYDNSYFTDCVSQKDAERAQAFIAVMRIAAYYNKNYANGWEADCNDPGQAKFRVAYDAKSKSYTVYVSFDSSYGNPAFATKELAQMALDNNKQIFAAYLQ